MHAYMQQVQSPGTFTELFTSSQMSITFYPILSLRSSGQYISLPPLQPLQGEALAQFHPARFMAERGFNPPPPPQPDMRPTRHTTLALVPRGFSTRFYRLSLSHKVKKNQTTNHRKTNPVCTIPTVCHVHREMLQRGQNVTLHICGEVWA